MAEGSYLTLVGPVGAWPDSESVAGLPLWAPLVGLPESSIRNPIVGPRHWPPLAPEIDSPFVGPRSLAPVNP